MKQFQFQPFQRQKNDVLFAFVIAAMFAVTLATAVAGAFDFARGNARTDVAKAHGQKIAMQNPEREAARAAHAGAR